MNEKSNFDINFAALFESLLKRFWIILLCAIIAAGASYVYTNFFVTPLYSSTATLYIGNNTSGQISINEVTISETLAKDFEEIIKKRAVLEEVIDTLDLDMSASEIRSCMTVKNITDTRILDITVATPNPALSKSIADTICTVASEKFVSIVRVEYVSVVDMGSMSSVPANINLVKSMVFAAFAGALICAFVIVLKTVRDDKIKNPDDVEIYLGLSVLGTTPFSRELDDDRIKNGKMFRNKNSKGDHTRA